MGERQAKIIETDIAEIFDEDSEGENLCCTIEAGTAGGEDVTVQVTSDSLTISPYLFSDDPLSRLEENGVLAGMSFELDVVDWEANVYAIVGIEGIEGMEADDVARLIDRIFVKLLGCDDDSYAPIGSTEELE